MEIELKEKCRTVIAKDEEKTVLCNEDAVCTVEINEGEDDIPLITPLCEKHKKKYLGGKSMVVMDQASMAWLIGSRITI